jgi:hypothetical protein
MSKISFRVSSGPSPLQQALVGIQDVTTTSASMTIETGYGAPVARLYLYDAADARALAAALLNVADQIDAAHAAQAQAAE